MNSNQNVILPFPDEDEGGCGTRSGLDGRGSAGLDCDWRFCKGTLIRDKLIFIDFYRILRHYALCLMKPIVPLKRMLHEFV